MTKDIPESPPRKGLFAKTFRTFRVYLIWMGVVLVMAIGVVTLPPFGLEWGVISALTRLGMSSVHVGDRDLALFGGKVVLEGVQAESKAAPAFSLGGLDMLFSWRPLLHKTVSLAKVSVDGLAVDIRRRPDGTVEINGLGLPAASQSTPPPAPVAGQAAPTSRPWSISLDGIHLRNSHVDYTDPSTKIALTIDELSIDALHSAEPNRPVHLELKARINDHPVAISGDGTPLAAHPHFNLHLTADGLDLALVSQLVQGLDIKGILTLNLDVAADLSPDQNWQTNADIKGNAELADFAQKDDIRLDSLKAENVDASWNGTGRILAASGTLHAVRAAVPGYSFASGDLAIERSMIDLGENHYKTAGRLSLTGLVSNGNGPRVSLGSLALTAQDAEAQLRQDNGQFTWQGGAILNTVAFASDGMQLNQGKLDWSGKIGGTLAHEQLQTLEATGHLALGGLDYHGKDQQATIDALTLDAQPISYGIGHVQWNGAMTVQSMALAAGTTRVEPAGLAWSGAVGAAMGDDGAVKTLTLAGHLDGGALKLTQPGLAETNGPFAADTDLALAFGDKVTVKGKAGGSVQKVKLGDGARLDYASLGKLAINDLRLAPDGGAVATSIVLTDAKALTKRGKTGFPWRIEAGRIGIDQAARSAKGALDIGAVAVDALTARVTLEKSGVLGLDALSSSGQDDGSQKEPLHLAMGRVTLDGASQVIFEDRTMDQPVDMTVANIRASITGVDSDKPEHDSPFRLTAAIGDATLTANGTVRPWAPKFTADAQAKVTAFELPQLSPYAKNTIGLNLQTGHFDGDANLGLSKGQMTGKLDVTLTNLNVTEPHGPTPLAKHAGLPIKTVLGLLQDDQGRIHLTIPISGDLSDPQFDVSDAVSQTIGGALKSTAQTTLEVLFPVAALIDVLGSDGGGLGLDPIPFAPGSDALGSEQDKRVEAIAALMKARPAVTLRLCGMASAAKDWPVMLDAKKQDELGVLYSLQKALNVQAKAGDAEKGGIPPDHEALKALADKRADKIRDSLTDSQGIDAARLYDCLSDVDDSADAVPRVELGF